VRRSAVTPRPSAMRSVVFQGALDADLQTELDTAVWSAIFR
jgi:hypothetical protein